MPNHGPRTRYRGYTGNPVAIQTTSGLYFGEPVSDHWVIGPTLQVTEKFSIIEDYLNSRDRSGDLPNADCDHFKLQAVRDLPAEVTYTNMYGLSQTVKINGVGFTPFYGPTDLIRHRRNSWFIPPPQGAVTEFGRKAFHEITSQFPEEFSLLNFLWELKELPQMLWQTAGLLKSIMSKSGVSKAFNSLTAAEVALLWKYGWELFLSDLQQIGGLHKKMEDRLEHLRRTKGKPVRAGFSARVDSPSVPYSVDNFGGQWNSRIELICTSIQTRLRATGRVQHDLPWLDDLQGGIRAFLGTMGISNPLKVIWNGLPLSFIADWFTGFGDFLNQFNIQQINNWHVDRLSWSISQLGTFGYKMHYWGGSMDLPGRIYARRYVRFRGLPTEGVVILTPTPQQAAIFAALGRANG